MTDRRRADLIDLGELEARLADLAGALAFPATPDLATTVGARLRASTSAQPIARPIPFRRPLRRSLLLAAALTLAIVGGVLAVRFGLELLSIRFGPVPTIVPSASPAARPSESPPSGTPAPLGASLGLGEPVTLEAASAAAAFELLIPAELGPPDVVFAGGPRLRGQIAFVYAPREDLPLAGLLGGAGLLITQNRGEPDENLAAKIVDSSQATIENVVVDGAPGVWISGGPHIFWYLAPDGEFLQDGRYVGDTLVWERDGVLYRIEGNLTLEQALAIATSMR